MVSTLLTFLEEVKHLTNKKKASSIPIFYPSYQNIAKRHSPIKRYSVSTSNLRDVVKEGERIFKLEGCGQGRGADLWRRRQYHRLIRETLLKGWASVYQVPLRPN
jgi:hypothetical protein